MAICKMHRGAECISKNPYKDMQKLEYIHIPHNNAVISVLSKALHRGTKWMEGFTNIQWVWGDF